MARKAKLTPEERAERQRARCKAYWAEHREEIALKRKIKREKDKAERKAREEAYREQAKVFLARVDADKEAMEFMRGVLNGGNPMTLIEEWAKYKA